MDVNDQTTQTVPEDESTVNEQTTNTESAETNTVKDGWSDDGYYYEMVRNLFLNLRQLMGKHTIFD